jgi:hypothetical protein
LELFKGVLKKKADDVTIIDQPVYFFNNGDINVVEEQVGVRTSCSRMPSS